MSSSVDLTIKVGRVNSISAIISYSQIPINTLLYKGILMANKFNMLVLTSSWKVNRLIDSQEHHQ